MATTTFRRPPTSQLLLGALVVLIGILLLLHTTDVFPTRNLLLYVPSLFVVIGVWALFQSRFRNLVGPVVLIGVAGAAQLVVLDYVTIGQVIVYWPVLVIALGLSIVAGQFRSRAHQTDDVFTAAFAAFGGVEKRNTSKSFTGGDLTAVFGGVELDLRDAVVDAPPAHINAVAMFGGVEIIVPRDWNVRLDVLPVLAGASDDRPRRDDEHAEVDLIVTGFAAFGDVSVTD